GVRQTAAAAPRVRLESKPAAPAAGSILVVEDESALAAAVTDALRDAGYTVDYAADGEQALHRVGEHAFDAVVCDLKMPRVDGKAFYRELATVAPALRKRVIFVTGDVAGTQAEEFLEESGCRRLARDRHRASGQVLFVDRSGPEAPPRRARQLEPSVERDQPGGANHVAPLCNA